MINNPSATVEIQDGDEADEVKRNRQDNMDSFNMLMENQQQKILKESLQVSKEIHSLDPTDVMTISSITILI